MKMQKRFFQNKLTLLRQIISLIYYSCLVGIFFIVVYVGSIIYSDTHPHKKHSEVTPNSFGLPYETISFYNKDNQLLKGWFIPSKKKEAKTIILLHGYGADKGNILPTRLFLHENFNLLFFDFRYFGDSEGAATSIGVKEPDDLAAAIQYLHTRGVNEVGVWGLSMGGAVALMSASKLKEIKAVVAESSYARLDMMGDSYASYSVIRSGLRAIFRWYCYIFYGVDLNKESPMSLAKRITIPVLLIHSIDDQLIPFSQAQLINNSLKNNPNAQFVITHHYVHSQFDPELRGKIVTFFDRELSSQ